VDDVDSDPDSLENFRSRIAYTRTTKPKGSAAQNVYDQIDLGLDFAQAQCERAAHQFLRDGDCAEEILLIRNKTIEITKLAKDELEREGQNERKQAQLDEKKQQKKAEANAEIEVQAQNETPPGTTTTGIQARAPDSGTALEVDPDF
jgi:hypothetical protein